MDSGAVFGYDHRTLIKDSPSSVHSGAQPTGNEPLNIDAAVRTEPRPGALPHLATHVGLCTRCGSCLGVCPHDNVILAEPLGACEPRIVDPRVCADCPAPCQQTCPGIEADFDAFSRQLFGKPYTAAGLLGPYREMHIAHATDGQVRARAASGGVLTAAVTYLLETGKVKGAVLLRMDPDRPYMAQPFIARTPEDVASAAQSKYSLSPVNVIFKAIQHEPGPLAYVGLPCQVHSLRKLQGAGVEWARRFKYVLGPYCGNMLHFGSVRHFLEKRGVTRLGDVAGLQYRAGEWPGNLRVDLRDGRHFELPKFHANHLIPFFIAERCLLCTDLANEFTDLAGGDAWSPVYEQRGQGFSIVVARTERGESLLRELVAAKRLELTAVSEEQALQMHSHGLDLKKRGAFLRLERRERRGLPTPWYNYRLAGTVPFARARFEWVLGWIFRICHWPFSRAVLRLIPDALMGRFFVTFRKIWKARTKKAKRHGLSQTAYESAPKPHVSMPSKVHAFDIEAVEKHWDEVAGVYERANARVQGIHDQRFEVGVPLLQLRGGERALNVWSRDGGAIRYLRRAAPDLHLTNAELSGRMMAIGQSHFPNERFIKLKDLGSFPFPEASFDRVLSLETLEHTPSQEVFIAQIIRVLKPGGVAVLSAPPRSAEIILRLYELFAENHGEGPHRFPAPRRVIEIIRDSGADLVDEFPSLVLPAGPRVLRSFADRIARRGVMRCLCRNVGLRHFYVFQKV